MSGGINGQQRRSNRMKPRMASDCLFSFIPVSLIYQEGSDPMNRLRLFRGENRHKEYLSSPFGLGNMATEPTHQEIVYSLE